MYLYITVHLEAVIQVLGLTQPCNFMVQAVLVWQRHLPHPGVIVKWIYVYLKYLALLFIIHPWYELHFSTYHYIYSNYDHTDSSTTYIYT